MSRPALFGYRAAALLASCAAAGAACDHGNGAKSTTPDTAGSVSAQPVDTSKAPDGPKVCQADKDCARGQSCCVTSVCGGRAAQAGKCGPEVRSCLPSPCPPNVAMPYGAPPADGYDMFEV